MGLGHPVHGFKDIRKKLYDTLDSEYGLSAKTQEYEYNRGDTTNLNSIAAWKVKWKKQEHPIVIYEKRKSYGGSKTEKKRKEKKTLISHPNIDFDINREIDLKA
ncbi:hypothetical protein I79_000741 [Cricetulus griseus]|uniref:Uncharacterized protein n=1 Tax=Cricetulus griseus TaxID=10029 RepID=G3GSW9_CRIGR|nr:hypothetical protein I79_000741 [Cricetulus griseus]